MWVWIKMPVHEPYSFIHFLGIQGAAASKSSKQEHIAVDLQWFSNALVMFWFPNGQEHSDIWVRSNSCVKEVRILSSFNWGFRWTPVFVWVIQESRTGKATRTLPTHETSLLAKSTSFCTVANIAFILPESRCDLNIFVMTYMIK